MLTSGRFADFVVVVGGREYKLHRCVLAATSQYFSAMLKDQTLEASEGRVSDQFSNRGAFWRDLKLQVELKDMDADVFDIMVRYTYDVKGPQSDEITMDLIKAVDMFVSVFDPLWLVWRSLHPAFCIRKSLGLYLDYSYLPN